MSLQETTKGNIRSAVTQLRALDHQVTDNKVTDARTTVAAVKVLVDALKTLLDATDDFSDLT